MTAAVASRDEQYPTIEFAPEYARPIRAGEKSGTVRLREHIDAGVGDEVPAVTDDGTPFATLRITGTAAVVAKHALGILDAMGATYGADTTGELLDGVSKHYEQDVDRGTVVEVIAFEVVAPDVGCEICGAPESENLTSDGHPAGPNLVVCGGCAR